MKKVVIVKIDKFLYVLKDQDNNEYKLKIEFQNIEEKPKTNDILFIDESILKENILLTFGPLGSKYGKDVSIMEESEVIKLIVDEKTIYLQRYYG